MVSNKIACKRMSEVWIPIEQVPTVGHCHGGNHLWRLQSCTSPSCLVSSGQWFIISLAILKIGHPMPSTFYLFSFFSNIYLHNEKCRLQQDSNSDYWTRRRVHWPLDHHYGPSFSYHLCASKSLEGCSIKETKATWNSIVELASCRFLLVGGEEK